MVSAIFHSPSSTLPLADTATEKFAAQAAPPASSITSTTAPRSAWKQRTSIAAGQVLPPCLGVLLMVGLWSVISSTTEQAIPTPQDTFKQAVDIFSDPFYRNGPNDQGVGWNVLASLQRVALGFGLAALVGIPLGLLMGTQRRFAIAMSPKPAGHANDPGSTPYP